MHIDKVLLSTLSDDESRKVLRLVEKGIRIPPQPRVLGELARLTAHGTPDLRILAATISEDPGICALLFKAVQSPVYRAHGQITSVERILQTIGVAPTINLIRAIALSSPALAGRKLQSLEAFWARSRAVAQIAMLVAEDRVAVCNIFPDQAYLAGVFHDCGVAVLMQRFTTYCKDLHLDEPGRWPNIVDEDARFCADHAVVGYLIARHWQLPDFVCDAIRYHHDFAGMEEHRSRTMVAMLQMAIHIYCTNSLIDNREWAGIRDAVLVELGIHDDALPEFVDVILERYQHA